MFIIKNVLAWMIETTWEGRHFENRTNLRLRLFFKVLPIDRIKIVRSFLCDDFNWLKTFINVDLFFLEIFAISRTWIKFISFRVYNVRLLGFLMRISILFGKMGSVCCTGIKRLRIRVELIVFNENIWLVHFLGAKLLGILRSGIERNILILIFDPRNNFFSHLWFLSRIMFSIC